MSPREHRASRHPPTPPHPPGQQSGQQGAEAELLSGYDSGKQMSVLVKGRNAGRRVTGRGFSPREEELKRMPGKARAVGCLVSCTVLLPLVLCCLQEQRRS